MRSLTFSFGFYFLDVPDSFWAFFCVTSFICATGVSNLLCEAFYLKMIPGDISGSMRGIFNFFGQIGTLSLTLLAGWLFDNVGPTAPFILVGILDFILVVVMLIQSCRGKLNIHTRNIKKSLD